MRKIRSVPFHWILPMTVLFGLSLVACGQPSGQASSSQGTLSGTLLSGPTCPGPEVFPERPGCANQPVRHLPIQITLPNGRVITTVTTDQDGHFTVNLPAGSYLVTARFGMRGLQSTPVRVVTGQTTTVQITLDTGLQ